MNRKMNTIPHCTATTIDNKFNPFTQFDQWYAYDNNEMHYNTLGLVAYFANTSTNLEEDEYNEEVSHAIDRLLELNPLGIHMKVYDYEADTLIPLANKAYEVLVKEQSR